MDETALANLFSEFQPKLVASLRRRFPWSPDLVEDAVQTAFLKLHQATTIPDEPRAWLRTVARHHIIDQLRAQGKTVPDEDAGEIVDPAPRVDASTVVSMPEPSLVQRALMLLTSRAQRLLRGKYDEDKTYGTLARQEGLAKSGMGRVLDRARSRWRKAVAELSGKA